MSVLSKDRKKACVDEHVLHSEDFQPVIAFRRDTMFTLVRKVSDSDVRTIVKEFIIDGSDNCDWRPVEDEGYTSS